MATFLTSCLFVGGSRHGQWHDVDTTMTLINVPVQPAQVIFRAGDRQAVAPNRHVETYAAMDFSMPDRRHTVYVYGEPDAQEVYRLAQEVYRLLMPRFLHFHSDLARSFGLPLESITSKRQEYLRGSIVEIILKVNGRVYHESVLVLDEEFQHYRSAHRMLNSVDLAIDTVFARIEFDSLIPSGWPEWEEQSENGPLIAADWWEEFGDSARADRLREFHGNRVGV